MTHSQEQPHQRPLTAMRLLAACMVLLALLALGCTSKTEEHGIPDAASIECHGHTGTAFPSFPRSCTTTADCMLVRHMTDCCANQLVLGISATALAAFQAAESTCDREYQTCG